ncbi:hypothetical protein, partial [Pseudomonas syringae]|uniref:hypothetical protein n=1 Tax=Pseudomonas syringae TaxID=317 RepID=UPI001E426824
VFVEWVSKCAWNPHAICLFEAGKSDSDLAFSKAGLVALALSFALMVAGLAVEFFEWRREGSQAL